MAVMSQPWKHPQSGIYYFRRDVPKELRGILDKREWKVSLKSKDLSAIRSRFAAESAKCEEAFQAARDQLQGRPRVVSSDAPKLADRWAREVLEQWEADPSALYEFLATVSEPGEAPHQVPAWEVVDVDPDSPDITLVLPFIQGTLAGAGLPVPLSGDPAREALRLAFLYRWRDLCTQAYARHSGDWRTPLDLPSADKPTSHEAKLQATEEAAKVSAAALPTLSQAFTLWETEYLILKPKAKDKSTIPSFKASVDTFIDLFGDWPVDQIKRQHIKDFAALLGKIPTKGQGLRKMTTREAIAYGDRVGLTEANRPTLATIKNKLRHLEAVFGVACRTYEAIGENPVTGSGIVGKVKRAIKAAPPRRTQEDKSYTRAELVAMFSSPLFTATGWNPPRADYGMALYWLPLILLYTGARREDAAKLYAHDIAPHGATGLWVFDIREGDDGDTVKNATSQRKVPVHQDLIDLGLLDYAASLPHGSRLFPKLTKAKADGFGAAVGRAWGNYLRDVVGLDSEADPAHGLRHTFKTLGRAAGIPEEVLGWIEGHAAATEGERYGSRPLSRMADEMKKFPSIAREAGLLPSPASGGMGK